MGFLLFFPPDQGNLEMFNQESSHKSKFLIFEMIAKSNSNKTKKIFSKIAVTRAQIDPIFDSSVHNLNPISYHTEN
jgi:hypothetical protein